MTYVILYRKDCDCWRETAPLPDMGALLAKMAELARWGVALEAMEVRGLV